MAERFLPIAREGDQPTMEQVREQVAVDPYAAYDFLMVQEHYRQTLSDRAELVDELVVLAENTLIEGIRHNSELALMPLPRMSMAGKQKVGDLVENLHKIALEKIRRKRYGGDKKVISSEPSKRKQK